MCAVQHNPVIRDHYQQLTKRGKAKKVALVAVANPQPKPDVLLLQILHPLATDELAVSRDEC